MKKKFAAVLIAGAALLTLSGCGETWEELAENKERCEALGGTYEQWVDGLVGADHSSCNFEDDDA